MADTHVRTLDGKTVAMYCMKTIGQDCYGCVAEADIAALEARVARLTGGPATSDPTSANQRARQ